MSAIMLDRIGIDFPIFGANKNLRLSLLSGMTGGRILPKHMQSNTVIIKALEDVSLELKSGDRIGLLGHNGAGKSTLLRVMAGVYYPTYGRLLVEGRLTPLLNLSPGIEVEDTGYENILTVGMLLGMSFSEIMGKAPEIIAFSELGDFIHFPVRSYSSGMQARLAFSIATALDPGILLLDEGIGAADARFADKASRRVKELMERTEILVLASHSDDLIDSMCNKAALLHHGRLLEVGSVESVRGAYRKMVAGSH
jgi:ABC-2 type transport system ATP-binding protein/lipopolysaccharide transport system ATP-binding protein